MGLSERAVAIPSSTYIYATLGDMLPGLTRLDETYELLFVRSGMFASPQPTIYESFTGIPDLGRSPDGETGARCDYLVLRGRPEVRVREVPQWRGGILYAVDEVFNPSAAIFRPGGVFGNDCLVAGVIMGTSDPRSGELYKVFQRELCRGYQRVSVYRVGPEAMRLLTEGWRLTQSAGAPREFDLHLPSFAN